MQKDFIPELQPLFCSRASLLQAQEKMNTQPNLDCQLRLRFSDGSQVPLNIKRADIESLIEEQVSNIEMKINETLDGIVSEETTQNI